MVRFASIRTILTLVARMDLKFLQMDVKMTFLHGEPAEMIFMDNLEGFESKGQERKVCRLNRSIYELKQSSRIWYLRFHQAILQFEFTMVEENYCVYLKRSNEKLLTMTLYVDEILMFSNDLEMITTTKD